jgi:hypothetical protein
VRERARAMSVCVCACAHVCVCVHLRARARCVRVCMRASVSACACNCAIPSDCVFARVCVASGAVRGGAVRALPSHGGGLRYLKLGPRRALWPRAWLRSARPAGCRARSAAGATWTSRTADAPWAGRIRHTSVVGAAGAIYVIGGYTGTTHLQDVWVSTDGGARPDYVGGVVDGYSRGYLGGTTGVLRGTKG